MTTVEAFGSVVYISLASDFWVNHEAARGGLACCFGSKAQKSRAALWLAWATSVQRMRVSMKQA